MTLQLAHRLDGEAPGPQGAADAGVPERKPPGKHTQVELFELLERAARMRRRAPNVHAAAPGRRTLVDRTRTRLRFDDYRALALKDLLERLGPDHPLRRDIANAAGGTFSPDAGAAVSDGARHGHALWQAAERHAVTLCRRAADAGEVDERDPAITAALERRGGGQPLPAELAREIEADLGVSLAQVRVHTDPVAAEAARAAHAEAFTVGEDIFFAEGAFAPDTSTGRALLVHELAHVAQTLRGRADAPRDGVQVSRPGDSLEREADDIARQIERNLGRRRELQRAAEQRSARLDPSRPVVQLDELRAIGLRHMLRAASAHGGPSLVDATLAEAAPEVARAARPSWTVRAASGQPGGRAMWHAAERYAATLYRRAADAGEVDKDNPAVEAALQRCGCGQPLPAAVRRKMEDQLGVSLERVRIHADQIAADAARAVHAEAFTVGEDIFFAEGAFAPDSPAGQRLLAHELTHVVQAWQGRTARDGRVSKPGDSLEREADTVAERVERGEPVRGELGLHGEPARVESAARVGPGGSTGRNEPAGRVEPAPRERPVLAAPLALAQTPESLALLRRAAGGQPRGRVPQLRGGARTAARGGKREMQGATTDFADRAGGAATQAASKLKAGVADARTRPPGQRASDLVKGDSRKAQGDQREARALEQRQREKARARASATLDAREPVLDQPTAGDRSPIKLKPITDWSKYMPQPLPDQDERERKRIEQLVKNKVEGERGQARQGLEKLRAAHIQQAADVRAMKPKLQAQIATAQHQALGHVAASEGSQCAAVQSHVAAVRGQVQGHAGAMKGQVTSAHAAAIAKINAAHQDAIKKLTDGKTKALADVDSAESLALLTLSLDFLRLKGRFTALGSRKAGDAITVGEEEAGNMSGRWDGEKLEAAQKAARDTADGFATSMPEQAAAKYGEIEANRPEAEKALRDFAKSTRDNINKTFDSAKQSLDTVKTQSIQAADAAKSGAISQIDQACASTVASLSAHGASQVAAIRKQGQAARTGITSAGVAARAAVAQSCEKAATGIEGGVTGLIRGAAQIEAPSPEETQQQVQQGAAGLEQGASSVSQGLSKTATTSSQGLGQQATTAAEGMSATASSANATATQIGAGARQQMTQIASGASDGLTQITTGHKTTTDGTVTATEKGYTDQVTALGTAYEGAATQRQTQFDESYSSTESGLNQAVPDRGGGGGGAGSGKKEGGEGEGGGGAAKGEIESIRENAQKAADAVKPWWQKALAVVVSIVVAIVVVIVVTALIATTGPIGAILVGAAAGALASVAGTMASNLVLGNGLFDGITWKTIAIGAIGGGLGAGLTAGLGAGASALAGSARFAGTALGRGAQATSTALSGTGTGLTNLAIKTGVEFGTDVASEQAANLIINHKLDLSVENLVLSLVTNAATGSPKFDAFQNRIQTGIQNRTGFSLNVPRLQIQIGHPSAPTGGAPAGGAPPAGGGPAPGTGPAPSARGPSTPGPGPGPGPAGGGPVPRPDGGAPDPTPGTTPRPGGTTPRPGDGRTPRPGDPTRPQGDGGPTPQGDGTPARPPQGDGTPTRPPGDGDRPPQQGDGDRPPQQGDGDRPPQQGDGDRPPQQGDGDRPPQGEGDGDRPPQGEGDGDRPPQGDGDPTRPPQDGDPTRPPQDGDPTRPPQDGDPANAPKGDGDPTKAPRGEGDTKPPQGDAPRTGDGEGARPDGDGTAPRTGDGPAPRTGDGPTQDASPEDAAAAARDAELGELGYTAGTRAKGEELAARIEQGDVPPRTTARDTEANQRGLRELQQLRSDPSLTPEQRAKLDREIAARLREQGDPAGNLPRDIQDARTRIQEAERATKAADEQAGDTGASGGIDHDGSTYRGDVVGRDNSHNIRAGVDEALAGLGVHFPRNSVRQTGPDRLEIDIDGTPVEVRIEVVPKDRLASPTDVANFDLSTTPPTIRISGNTKKAHVERALAHELAEMTSILEARSGTGPDRGTRNALAGDSPAQRLSHDDVGRLAELRVLMADLNNPRRPRSETRTEIKALLRELGLLNTDGTALNTNGLGTQRRALVEAEGIRLDDIGTALGLTPSPAPRTDNDGLPLRGEHTDPGAVPRRDVTYDEVDAMLPADMVAALERFGLSRDTIVRYLVEHHNNRSRQRYLPDLEGLARQHAPDGLTPEDVMLIDLYTTKLYYKELNARLREGRDLDTVQDLQAMLNDALAHLPPVAGATLYRSIDLRGAQLADFLDACRSGTLRWDSFNSVSSDAGGTFAGQNLLFEISNGTAYDISDFADGLHYRDPAYPGRELLMPGGVEFRVTGMREETLPDGTKRWRIQLEQIPPPARTGASTTTTPPPTPPTATPPTATPPTATPPTATPPASTATPPASTTTPPASTTTPPASTTTPPASTTTPPATTTTPPASTMTPPGSTTTPPGTSTITAAAVPGSTFTGRPGGSMTDAQRQARAAENTAEGGRQLTSAATAQGMTVTPAGPSTYRITTADGELTVRVTSEPLEGTEVANTVVNPTKDAHVIRISDQADTSHVERAMAHELAEIMAIRTRHREGRPTSGDDALAPGEGTPAQLSPHDHGRLAELGVLRRQQERAVASGDADGVASARREIQALLEHLGLREGTPGADARRRLIEEQGNVPPDTLAMVDEARRPRDQLDSSDQALLAGIDHKAAADAQASRARAERDRAPYEVPILGRQVDPAELPALAQQAAAARQARSDAVVADLRAQAAALPPGEYPVARNPQLGGGASVTALEPGQLFVDARGRWHADASERIAQTAHQLGGIEGAGSGRPSEFVDHPSTDRPPLDAIRYMQDTIAAQANVVNGTGHMHLADDGRLLLTIQPEDGGPPITVQVEGTPVIGTGFPPENLPRSRQTVAVSRDALLDALPPPGTSQEVDAVRQRLENLNPADPAALDGILSGLPPTEVAALRSHPDQRVRRAAETSNAASAWRDARAAAPTRVLTGQEANLDSLINSPDFETVTHWVIAGPGGTGISAAEIILARNPNARVTMVGGTPPAGLVTNDQFQRVLAQHGPGGDNRFQIVTDQEITSIASPDGNATFTAGEALRGEAHVDAAADTVDPTSAGSFLVDTANPRALDHVRTILEGNPAARVTLSGADLNGLTPEMRAELARLIDQYGPAGGARLQVVTGPYASNISPDPNGGFRTNGPVGGEGYIAAVGFTGNPPPQVQGLIDNANARGWPLSGRLLFDADGQYLGYRVTVDTPTGPQSLDVVGGASRAGSMPAFIYNGFDPDTGTANSDLITAASARDAPPEGGNFDGGYLASATQGARYGRHRRKTEGPIAPRDPDAEPDVDSGSGSDGGVSTEPGESM